MREIRCPACYTPLNPPVNDVDWRALAEELDMTVAEVKKAIEAELDDGYPITCESCQTVFTPADQSEAVS